MLDYDQAEQKGHAEESGKIAIDFARQCKPEYVKSFLSVLMGQNHGSLSKAVIYSVLTATPLHQKIPLDFAKGVKAYFGINEAKNLQNAKGFFLSCASEIFIYRITWHIQILKDLHEAPSDDFVKQIVSFFDPHFASELTTLKQLFPDYPAFKQFSDDEFVKAYQSGFLVDLNKLAEAFPNNCAAQFVIGYVYDRNKDFQNARKYYKNAMDINPEKYDVRAYYAKTCFELWKLNKNDKELLLEASKNGLLESTEALLESFRGEEKLSSSNLISALETYIKQFSMQSDFTAKKVSTFTALLKECGTHHQYSDVGNNVNFYRNYFSWMEEKDIKAAEFFTEPLRKALVTEVQACPKDKKMEAIKKLVFLHTAQGNPNRILFWQFTAYAFDRLINRNTRESFESYGPIITNDSFKKTKAYVKMQALEVKFKLMVAAVNDSKKTFNDLMDIWREFQGKVGLFKAKNRIKLALDAEGITVAPKPHSSQAVVNVLLQNAKPKNLPAPAALQKEDDLGKELLDLTQPPAAATKKRMQELALTEDDFSNTVEYRP